MLLIPLLYFIGLGIYFYKKQQCWNIDIAAVSLLVLISFFAINVSAATTASKASPAPTPVAPLALATPAPTPKSTGA